MRFHQLHPDTQWVLHRTAEHVERAEMIRAGLLPVGMDQRKNRGVFKGEAVVRARGNAIRLLRTIRIGGRPASTTLIGELLGLHHSTVVLALKRADP